MIQLMRRESVFRLSILGFRPTCGGRPTKARMRVLPHPSLYPRRRCLAHAPVRAEASCLPVLVVGGGVLVATKSIRIGVAMYTVL